MTIKLDKLTISLRHYTMLCREADKSKEILRKVSGGPCVPAYLVRVGENYLPAASSQLARQAYNRA